ncbi:DNA-3-methyladenine glycosylase family protein [Chelativorans sp. YIM 93263]|uniref:DNA-3-methyladenine glycosylase family protein n=1 Tax=Chelativorans sp. YIM 93263 TaxID=2906648 RepID=UPI0023786A89|nr:DNA-3-methyladenine glycosylase [Chelativorans sp. YIM 93263]
MQRIETVEDIGRGLDVLVACDARLAAVRRLAGDVPLRRRPPGLQTLASIIVAQQVSRASAEAIFGRLCKLAVPFTAQQLLELGEEGMVQAGLSRAKQRALTALSMAIVDGKLELAELCDVPAEQAIADLVAVPGIGPWTAQVYLLTAAGHPDIFPAGDVALQTAARHALALDVRPNAKVLAHLAESWRPWRSVAARLLWAYYREMKGAEAAPGA